MKNIIFMSALALSASLMGCGAEPAASTTTKNLASMAPVHLPVLYVHGDAAQQLFDILKVPSQNPEANLGHGGINPLKAHKDFVSSNKEITVACEIRLFNKSCNISVANTTQFNSDQSITVRDQAAQDLYDVLNITSIAGGQLASNRGINPLQGFKHFMSTDGKASVTCEMRLYSKECTLATYY